MDTKAAIVAVMSVCEATEDAGDKAGASDNPLLNKVWVRIDADPALPGPMQIFLGDGTLVSDSCWETYRLSRWQQVSDSTINWDEDGMTINAEIARVTDTELVLNLTLGEEVQEQRFVSATVPYVCPDMVK